MSIAPYTPPIPYTKAIEKAHESGHLFVHMFESFLEDHPPEALNGLFDVMAKKSGAHYKNRYGHDFQTTPYGILGLPTTALKKDYPVQPYTADSRVGLLMNTAKPILVTDDDAGTQVSGNHIRFARGKGLGLLKKIQGITDEFYQGVLVCGFDMLENIGDRFAHAAKALSQFWHHIQTIGWDQYMELPHKYPGQNEVNVAATLSDICGIIVAKPRFEDRLLSGARINYPRQSRGVECEPLKAVLNEGYGISVS